MRRSGEGSGGGHGSKNIVQKPVKTGSGSKGISPGWVGQRGQKQGSHTTHGGETEYRGEPKLSGKNFQPVKFGNEVALNVGKGGCGAGRTIHSSGSQSQHGDVAGSPRPAGRDILNNE